MGMEKITPIWDLVINEAPTATPQGLIDDMRVRDVKGRLEYGAPLTAYNGRDAVQDAYEEALDGLVYLRQAREEGYEVSEQLGVAWILANALYEVKMKEKQAKALASLARGPVRGLRARIREMAMIVGVRPSAARRAGIRAGYWPTWAFIDATDAQGRALPEDQIQEWIETVRARDKDRAALVGYPTTLEKSLARVGHSKRAIPVWLSGSEVRFLEKFLSGDHGFFRWQGEEILYSCGQVWAFPDEKQK